MVTNFLFAMPTFCSGMGRILDLGGVFDSYNERRSSQEADAIAMYADFSMVGQDLVQAMEVWCDANWEELDPKELRNALLSRDDTRLTHVGQE